MDANSTRITRIPTRGATFPVLIALGASTFVVVVGGLFIYFVETVNGNPLPRPDLIVPVGLIVIGAVFIPVPALLRRPREVARAEDGVSIRYPSRRVQVHWKDMMTIQFVGQGMVTFSPLSGGPASRGSSAYGVSLEQARAILDDPRCPKIALTDEVRRAIYSDSDWKFSAGVAR